VVGMHAGTRREKDGVLRQSINDQVLSGVCTKRLLQKAAELKLFSPVRGMGTKLKMTKPML